MVGPKTSKPRHAPNIWQLLGLYIGVFGAAVVAAVYASGKMFCFVDGGFLCETSGLLLGPVLAFPLTILAIHRLLSGRWLPSSKERAVTVALVVSFAMFSGLFYLLTLT